jgi:predicted kinase
VTVLLSGLPGAGKSTVAAALARRWSRSVHLNGDEVGERFIVRGFVPPEGPPVDEAAAQLLLRRRHLCLLARSFETAGFRVIVDDVVVSPEILDLYRHLLDGPLQFVQLTPDIEVLATRDAVETSRSGPGGGTSIRNYSAGPTGLACG